MLHALPRVCAIVGAMQCVCAAMLYLSFQFCVHVVRDTCRVLTTDGCELSLQPQLVSWYPMLLLQHLYRCAHKVFPA